MDNIKYSSIHFSEHKRFWEKELNDVEEFCLRQKGYQSNKKDPVYDIVTLDVDQSVHSVLTEISGTGKDALGVYVLYISALQIVLARYVSSHNVYIHLPAHPADAAVYDKVMFTSAVRQDLTLRAHILQVREKVLQLYRYQNFPWQSLLPADAHVRPLTNIKIAHDELHQSCHSDDALTILLAKETIRLQYDQRFFTGEFIAGIGQHLHYVLEQFADLTLTLDKIDILSPREQDEILVENNLHRSKVDHEDTLVSLYLKSVKEHMQRQALIARDIFTYEQLDQVSNTLAHYLRTESGIRPGDMVGVMMDKSQEYIISILGILKAGGAYVPIDPMYPQERIDFVLGDAPLKELIIHSNFMLQVGAYEGKVFVMDLQMADLSYGMKGLDPVNVPEDLAYMIYTSGSTGTPKGVLISHASIVNTVRWRNQYYKLQYHVNLQIPSLAFDSSVEDIFCTLTTGSCLVLPEEDKRKDVQYLCDLIQAHRVTHFLVVPSFYKILLEAIQGKGRSLQAVTVAGEALKKELVAHHYAVLPKVRLVNEYGPTENAVCSTACDILPGISRVTIGRPILNVEVYILDASKRPVPKGVEGEIYLSGIGLAKGYYNRADLTDENFLPNPFSKKYPLMYKTGDLGLWHPYGHIEYIGRKDDQVKIRGFRIEPKEIEVALEEHPNIEQSIVLPYSSGESVLLFAFFKSSTDIQEAELRFFLSKKLPEYMIPARFFAIGFIPLTVHGKINKTLLLKDAEKSMQAQGEQNALATRTEEQVAVIIRDILGVSAVSRDDNFFSLGGNSLSANLLRIQILNTLGVDIPLRTLFKKGTLAEVAQLIDNDTRRTNYEIPRVEDRVHYPLTHAQRRIWILEQRNSGSNAYNMPGVYRIVGSLEVALLEKAFRMVMQRHEILRTRFFESNGEAVMKVLEMDECDYSIRQLDTMDSQNPEREAIKVLNEIIHQGFDLGKDHLVRTVLVRTDIECYTFAVVIHHIVFDGWSSNVLLKEVTSAYNSMARREPVALNPLSIQFRDYAYWESTQARQYEVSRAYWLHEMNPLPDLAPLPYDFSRKNLKTFKGSKFLLRFSDDLSNQIHTVKKDLNVTSFVFLTSFIKLLISCKSSSDDITIGVPVLNRELDYLKDQIGLYINNIVLRTQFHDQEPVTDFILRTRNKVVEALAHQQYPYDQLIEDIKVPRTDTRNPLYDVMVVMDTQLTSDEKTQFPLTLFDQTIIEPVEFEYQISKLDLTFFIYDRQPISIDVEYSTELFRRDTIQRLANELISLVEAYLKDPSLTVLDIKRKLYGEKASEQASFAYSMNMPLKEDF
jgi:bacitracin synthase 3